MVFEREYKTPGETVFSQVGPLLFSRESLALDYVCSQVLVPQLEEWLFDAEPALTSVYATVFDGRHVREPYRLDYSVLKAMAHVLLFKYLDWTVTAIEVDAEVDEEGGEKKKRRV